MKISKWALAGAAVAALGTVTYAQYRSNSEEPDYTSIQKDGAIELRDYPALVVAEVTHIGDRRRAAGAGFRRLAAYIFAQDRPGAKIAMTAPVLQDQTQKIAMNSPVIQDAEQGGAWRTRFIMPPEYTLDTLPEAAEDITLTELPARRMAAIRFSGNGNGADLRENEDLLRSWIAEQDGLSITGEAEFAFYDAPMVPPPIRRNEVMIPVASE